MPDKGKKRGLSPEQWADVRNAHSKGESDLSIAKRLGIHRNTIRNRREADAKRGDPWTVQPDVHLHSDEAVKAANANAQSKVIDLATRRAVESLEQSGAIDEAAEHIAAHLLRSSRIRDKMAQAMENFADDLIANKIHPAEIPGARDRSQVMKDSLGAWKLFESMFREAEGLRSGQPTVPKDTDDGKPSVIELEIVDGPPQAEAS